MIEPMDASERFGLKYVAAPSGCWLWSAHVNKSGYGTFYFDGDCSHLAHRAAWKLFRGSIPAGMQVLHRCDTRACVNPDHLFLGTHADNVADKVAKRRQATASCARFGTENPKTKLSDAAVEAIQASHASGMSQRGLARRYGVHYMTIYEIVHRRRRSRA